VQLSNIPNKHTCLNLKLITRTHWKRQEPIEPQMYTITIERVSIGA